MELEPPSARPCSQVSDRCPLGYLFNIASRTDMQDAMAVMHKLHTNGLDSLSKYMVTLLR